MNPHVAVEAPGDRLSEWNDVLADYDQHCHDVIRLDRGSFKTVLPIRLLNAEDQQRFTKEPGRPPAEFADGAGLHRFTEVFFNANHTLALVEQGMWCGSLCGNWMWVVLERRGAMADTAVGTRHYVLIGEDAPFLLHASGLSAFANALFVLARMVDSSDDDHQEANSRKTLGLYRDCPERGCG